MEFNNKVNRSFFLVGFIFLVFAFFPHGSAISSNRQEMIRQRLEAEISDLESTVEQLEEQLNEAENRIEKLEKTIAERDERIEDLKREKQELEQTRQTLKRQLDDPAPTETVEEPEVEPETEVEEVEPEISEIDRDRREQEDIERSGLLWISEGRNYPVRRYPLDYELTITTDSIDSLSRLDHQYYRDADYGIEIYRANRDRLPDQQTLPRDTRLTLPPYGRIRGRPVDFSITKDPARIVEEDFNRQGEFWETEGRTYPVRTRPLDYELILITGVRDSLTRLAHQYYGSYRHWEALYETNRERIDNPDLLPGGTRLRLPPLVEIQEFD